MSHPRQAQAISARHFRMARNRLRLQLALYARPKYPDTYHYALFVAPKSAQCQTPITKHHVKNTLEIIAGDATQPWRYERTVITRAEDEQRLLVRVVVAKLTGPRELIDHILESVPIYQDDDVDRAQVKTFTCRTWVRDALQLLAEREAISGFSSWIEVERASLEYVNAKQNQRRWSNSWTGPAGVPLLDPLNSMKEIVP